MELPFKSFPFLEYVVDKPMFVVIWAAFGVPLLMFILSLLARLYKGSRFASYLNTIIFSSLGFTWISGFIITIILLFTGTSGIKLYLIWICLCFSSIIFSAINCNSISKLYDDFLKENSKNNK